MPVYSSDLVDYRGLGIGRRIREERQRKKLTLRQLASRIYVSEAKLSNIERDDRGQRASRKESASDVGRALLVGRQRAVRRRGTLDLLDNSMRTPL